MSVLAWHQLRLSQSRELAAHAELRIASDPVAALELAVEAVRREPTLEAERALGHTVQAQRTHWIARVPAEVEDLAFAGEGDLIATADSGGVRLWDVDSAALVARWRDDHGVIQVSASPDGTRLAWGNYNGEVFAAGRDLQDARSVIHHETTVLGVRVSPNSRHVATASEDGTVRLLEKGLRQWILHRGDDMMRVVAFSPDGGLLLGGGDGETTRVWELVKRQQIFELPGSVYHAEFSSDGSLILTAGDGGSSVWDAQTGVPLCELGARTAVYHGTFSPAGDVVAIARDNAVEIWALASCGPKPGPRVNENIVRKVVFSADGRYLAWASEDTTARVWDVENEREVQELRGHRGRVLAIAFSPRGYRLATASDDGTVRLWQADATGAAVTTTTVEERPIALARSSRTHLTSSDGRLSLKILDNAEDGSARILDAAQGTSRVIRGDGRKLAWVGFSPDDNRVLALAGKESAKVWDVKSGAEIYSFGRGAFEVKSAWFSPDGSTVEVLDSLDKVHSYPADVTGNLALANTRREEWSPWRTRVGDAHWESAQSPMRMAR